MRDWIDLGHEHRARFTAWHPDRDINPHLAHLPDVDKWGLIVEHPDARDRSKVCAGGITFDGEVQRELVPEKARWQVVSLERETLHVEPSLLCICGDHGFIRGGQWIPA